ncbi:MAG: choice-of-anchor tandem repeat GloVer-containing protein [Bryobacteraceae bacterium]
MAWGVAVADPHADTVAVGVGRASPVGLPYNPPTSGAITAGDVNHDGKPDLVVAANANSDGICVLIGNGDGTFQNGVFYTQGSNTGATAVAIGQFIANDSGDVVMGTGNGAYVYLNNGDGTFATPVLYGPGWIDSIVVADINGDGKNDLMVSSYLASAVWVMLGNGEGGFTAGSSFATDGYPNNLVVADFNGDKKLDFATSNRNGQWVTVGLGNGDGTFRSSQSYGYSFGNAINGIATADLNNDGNLDIVEAGGGTGVGLTVMLGSSHGVFGAPTSVTLGCGNVANSVALGDVNRDGNVDAVATTTNGGCQNNEVAVLEGLGTGNFNAPVYYSTGSTEQSTSIQLADFRGDGRLDIVVSNGDGSLSVLLNNGQGVYGAATVIAGASGADAGNIVIGDFNNDGKLDIAVTDYSQQQINVLLGNGDGTFQSPIGTASPIHLNPSGLAGGDFNNDGKLDLAVTGEDYSGSLVILTGNGDGTFTAGAPYQFGTFEECTTESGPYWIGVGDLNQDGKLDLAIAVQSENCSTEYYGENSLGSAVIYTGNGDGTFNLNIGPWLGGVQDSGIVLGDFNSDGMTDMAVVGGAGWATYYWATIMLNNTQPVSVSPLAIKYKAQYVNTSGAAQTVLFTNDEKTSLGVGAAALGGTDPGDFTFKSGCPGTLLPGAYCTLAVTFIPTTAGARTATLSIADGAGTQSVSLTGTGADQHPAQLAAVRLSPPSVAGGDSSAGNEALLTGLAPAGGGVVSLSSSNPAVAAVPASVTVPAGASGSPGFTIATSAVTAQTPVTITAVYQGVTKTATLTVYPLRLASVTLSPQSVLGGGSTSNNELALTGPATPAGAVVSLSSGNPAVAAVPATVTVPAGATDSPAFTITSTPVAAPTLVTITARYQGVTKTGTLTVNPAQLESVTLSPQSAVGGVSTTGNQVVLNGGAPAAGAVVSLSSGNPAIAAVPASVTVPAGTADSPFTIRTGAVTAPTPVTITARYQGLIQTATLTLYPAQLASVALSPQSVAGGGSTTNNEAVLTGPAPAGGALVYLSSGSPAVAAVPATVTVPAGAAHSPAFTITTINIAAQTAVTITAVYQGVTQTATLTVNPAPPFATLYTFNVTNGADPYAGPLVQGTDGNLYGTTYYGGANAGELSGGTIFKITPSGTLTTVYNFCAQTGCTDGSFPAAGLIQATDGNLYGTTSDGGTGGPCYVYAGCGTVFKITPSGTLTTLYNFCSETANDVCTDGASPVAGLVQATNGDFYGTTAGDSYTVNAVPQGTFGTVFKITSGGTLTTLYSFCSQPGCTDGAAPYAGLLQATDGYLYGSTSSGGASGNGTIFKITPSGTLTTVYSFCSQPGCTDGVSPNQALVQAANGNLYGTTPLGGTNEFCTNGLGCGTVFKFTPTGTLTTIYNFCSIGSPACTDGALPNGLLKATDGNFYGSTSSGGAASGSSCGLGDCGTLFKITPTGTLTTLYDFCSQTNCTDGQNPLAPLVQDTNGDFYGTTFGTGTCTAGATCGTIFSLSLGISPFVETQTTSGAAGAAVDILGTNLTGANSVSFNGTAAAFTVLGPSAISATVPAGATTGFVQVTTPYGTFSSHVPFQVLP